MFDWKHCKNTVKSNVLEGFTGLYGKKRCKLPCVLTGNIGKNTVKNNVLEGFLIDMLESELATGIGTRKN